MPDPKLQKKKTSPLYYLLLFVILLAGGYYLYTYVFSTPSIETELNAALPIKTGGDWGRDLFNNPSYTNLFNPIPGRVEPGPMGNPTPFVQVAPSAARR
ncbi:MAG: hypothetical protein AAB870_02745 [Patescibacteria group bacterium]